MRELHRMRDEARAKRQRAAVRSPAMHILCYSQACRWSPSTLQPNMTRLRLSRAVWKPAGAQPCGQILWQRSSRPTCRRRYELTGKKNSNYNPNTYLRLTEKRTGPLYSLPLHDRPLPHTDHPLNSAESDAWSLSI